MGAPGNNRNLKVAAAAGSVAVVMLGLAYASVPLYSLFCKATGFGGTPQRAEKAPEAATSQLVTIRFDANTAGSLGWNFRAKQTTMPVKIGEQYMARYQATNTSDHELTGSAVFNVTPESAGAFFDKIQCFCFTEQTLKPGETADFPVVFFVDPAILDDLDTKSIKEITLSYTFYPAGKSRSVSLAEQPLRKNSN